MANPTAALCAGSRAKRLTIVPILCLLMGLAACSSDSTPDPTTATISILATEQLNPNVDGSPAPVVVILYELKSKSTFESAEFPQLFYDGRATLGGDLLGIQELEIKPGLKEDRMEDFSPETRILGVVAGYRNLNNATWRASTAITPEQENSVLLTIDSLALSLRPASTPWWKFF